MDHDTPLITSVVYSAYFMQYSVVRISKKVPKKEILLFWNTFVRTIMICYFESLHYCISYNYALFLLLFIQ